MSKRVVVILVAVVVVFAGAITAFVLAPSGDGAAQQLADGRQAVDTPTTASGDGAGVTAIGDSVMLAAAPELKKRFPGMTVDAKESRQMSAAPGIIKDRLAHGDLGSVVIIGLGTNGSFADSVLADVEQEIGARRRLLLVNVHVPRPWQDQVNQTLAAAAHRPEVSVVDWNAAITPHPDLLWSDGIHAKPAGARLYTDLIAKALA